MGELAVPSIDLEAAARLGAAIRRISEALAEWGRRLLVGAIRALRELGAAIRRAFGVRSVQQAGRIVRRARRRELRAWMRQERRPARG